MSSLTSSPLVSNRLMIFTAVGESEISCFNLFLLFEIADFHGGRCFSPDLRSTRGAKRKHERWRRMMVTIQRLQVQSLSCCHYTNPLYSTPFSTVRARSSRNPSSTVSYSALGTRLLSIHNRISRADGCRGRSRTYGVQFMRLD